MTMAAVSKPEPERGAAPAARTILVVEDNALNLKLFADLLGAAGFAVVAAQDGREAMALARRRRPDLVVMDIQLPEISGLEVTRWLKADPQLARVPVLAMTAFGNLGSEGALRAGGCDAYMAKPIVSARAFLSTVRQLLGEPADADAALFGAPPAALSAAARPRRAFR